ncbi:MAG: hypothetical protein AAB370_03115 [Verrucomicrobiota bacterium]
MKFWFAALMAMALIVNGCVFRKAASAKSAPPTKTPAIATPVAAEQKPEADPKLIVTPENLLVGKVATFNTAGRFVVLDFPIGKMPALDQVMFVYRQGLKVGEVRITGPERDHNTVADLISGEARKGDEVRDK